MKNLQQVLFVWLFCSLNLIPGFLKAQKPIDGFPAQVRLDAGTIEGTYETKTGLRIFLGIPYAAPPVGNLRWAAPQPVTPWADVKATKSFGPRAVQAPVFGDMRFRSNGMSEDCLYLNVWTPAKRNTSGLPVLVYFYGGGFSAGDGSEPRYDGARMATKGIVTVTVNSRLHIFGFYAHPELSKEAPYKASGNYGLMDQAAALQWVQKNIAAFGGDPKRVTIAGESAGSASVSAQMISPLSRNLIAGAIGESGAAITPTLAAVSVEQAEQEGLKFAQQAGAPSLAALRAMSTQEVYEIFLESRRFGFPLVLDGYFFPKDVADTYKQRKQAQVPLLLGWNSAEIPAMALMNGKPLTKENFVSRVKEIYPDDFNEVLKLFPHDTPSDLEWAATNLASDRFIVFSTWKWFDLHRKNSNQPVYRYVYSKIRPPMRDQNLVAGLAGGVMARTDNAPAPQAIGAVHSAEIEYCMGNLSISNDYEWTKDDYTVSETMMNYFANFIIKGNPNGDNLPEWPAAAANDKQPPVMILDVQSKAIKSQDEARFEFHDKFFSRKK